MARLLFAMMLVLMAGNAGASPSVQDILARNKQASGGNAWDMVGVIRMKAHAETSGLSGTLDSVTDVKTGRFSDSFVLGTFKGANGFDGKVVWEVDTSGQVVLQESADQREGAVNEAYRRSQSYWYSNRQASALSLIGEKSVGQRTLLGVRAVPKGGRPFDMWFDASTFLLVQFEERNARELRTTFLSDYRSVSGLMIPYLTRQTNGDAKYDTIAKLESVKLEGDATKVSFAPPAPPPRDFGFSTAARSAVIPFKLINNHIYLQVSLNGRPYQFLFDTGGLNVITPTVARELGLKTEGALQARGTGEKSQEAGFTKVTKLDVGGAWLRDQTFVVIGLESFSEVEGMPITGIIGYEVFKRFIVVTDYENSKVVLIEPEGFAYRGAGLQVPIKFNDRTPQVEGGIDGFPGTFTLDTGARNSLSLGTPFVEKNSLVSRYAAKFQGVTGWGVGGPARSWIVRGKTFTIGSVAISDPVVELSQNKSGAMADAYLAGNVGAGVLKRFNIVWDYGHNRIWMERNRIDRDRDTFDRAGFWINVNGNGFAVIDVIAGSPAASADLKQGDLIVGVNGAPAVSGISLVDLRRLKLGPVGSVIRLDVLRNGKPMTVSITLADFI